MSEHAILIHISVKDTHGFKEERDAVFALEKELEKAINNAEYGELDGDEFGDGQAIIYLYAPDADKLHKIIDPILKCTNIAQGARVITRYGDADDNNCRQVETVIS
jgi:hypothetical protein